MCKTMRYQKSISPVPNKTLGHPKGTSLVPKQLRVSTKAPPRSQKQTRASKKHSPRPKKQPWASKKHTPPSQKRPRASKKVPEHPKDTPLSHKIHWCIKDGEGGRLFDTLCRFWDGGNSFGLLDAQGCFCDDRVWFWMPRVVFVATEFGFGCPGLILWRQSLVSDAQDCFWGRG